MKKLFLLFFLPLIFSCSSVKETQTLISQGKYDKAIDLALENLSSNKDKKSKQQYVYLLEEAFAKAKEKGNSDIYYWSKDPNPALFDNIYNTYLQMRNRQERIKPILPLKLLKEGRNAIFPFEDYSEQIANIKTKLANYLYNNANQLMARNGKLDFRKAFDDLNYLQSIYPDYKNTDELILICKTKGTDFALLVAENQTNMALPNMLVDDLMDFGNRELNGLWTIFHTTKSPQIKYDYMVKLEFKEIIISPEYVKEKQLLKEKVIEDGLKKVLDKNGNEIKDRDGKPLTEKNFRKVNIRINETRQFKTCNINANINIFTFQDQKFVTNFPLNSQFTFENIYGVYQGDIRASDNYPYFYRKPLPFPSNEQMISDTGFDIKEKLKSILSKNSLR